MRLIYDAVFLLFSIAYLPYLLIKGKAHGDFLQRFGVLPGHLKGSANRTIWVHTVSVGEVIAAKPFINRLKEEFPGYRIVLSTTTVTGQETAKSLFGGMIPVFYFPLDFHFTVDRAIEFIRPSLFVVFETELWPNMIAGLSLKGIPAILVNGRISDKSFRGYKLISPFISGVLRKINLFSMQTEEDARRIKQIGALGENVLVSGNVKYDTAGTGSDPALVTKDEYCIADSEDILIGGSTHRGEEEVLLKVYRNLLKTYGNLRLFLAPRHVDRAAEVEDLCGKLNFTAVKTSALSPGGQLPKNTVIILDTIGKLGGIYGIGTVIFVGGSLVKRGGHNIIEPARFAKAIIFGPHMNNFRDMASRFLAKKAAMTVNDENGLEEAFSLLLKNEDKRKEMGSNAFRIVEENKGAVGRTIELIKKIKI